MLPCLVCSFTTATNRTIRSSEDGATSTTASQPSACDNNFTAYKDLKGRGRDLSIDGGVLRNGPLAPPNLRPPLLRRLRYRRSASSRQVALLHANDFTLPEPPIAFAAARRPFNWWFSLPGSAPFLTCYIEGHRNVGKPIPTLHSSVRLGWELIIAVCGSEGLRVSCVKVAAGQRPAKETMSAVPTTKRSQRE